VCSLRSGSAWRSTPRGYRRPRPPPASGGPTRGRRGDCSVPHNSSHERGLLGPILRRAAVAGGLVRPIDVVPADPGGDGAPRLGEVGEAPLPDALLVRLRNISTRGGSPSSWPPWSAPAYYAGAPRGRAGSRAREGSSMEDAWYADRAALRVARREHPRWSGLRLARELGRSLSWVKKWRRRLAAAPAEDEAVLHSRSRARRRPPPAVDPRAVARIVRLRNACATSSSPQVAIRRRCASWRRRSCPASPYRRSGVPRCENVGSPESSEPFSFDGRPRGALSAGRPGRHARGAAASRIRLARQRGRRLRGTPPRSRPALQGPPSGRRRGRGGRHRRHPSLAPRTAEGRKNSIRLRRRGGARPTPAGI
jgi:hypothetical protein